MAQYGRKGETGRKLADKAPFPALQPDDRCDISSAFRGQHCCCRTSHLTTQTLLQVDPVGADEIGCLTSR